MKVLVTGGAGFIGSNLVKKLVEDGNFVTVLDNLSSGYLDNISSISNVRFINGDIRNQNDVENAVEGSEVVYHLAASVGNKRSIDCPVADSEVNVIGTIKLLEASVRAGVKKIVASSSAGIYGELISNPIGESHPIRPDTQYGCSKLAMEMLCLAYSKMYQIEAICLRYFNVYGIGQRYDKYGNVIPIFTKSILQNNPIVVYGNGMQTRDFVNVMDVVQANIKASKCHGVSGAFNIGSGKDLKINSLIEILERVAGKVSCKSYGEPRLGDVLNSTADISLARDVLGYNPIVPFEAGIAEYFQWAAEDNI